MLKRILHLGFCDQWHVKLENNGIYRSSGADEKSIVVLQSLLYYVDDGEKHSAWNLGKSERNCRVWLASSYPTACFWFKDMKGNVFWRGRRLIVTSLLDDCVLYGFSFTLKDYAGLWYQVVAMGTFFYNISSVYVLCVQSVLCAISGPFWYLRLSSVYNTNTTSV